MPFRLESGAVLAEYDIFYQTYGAFKSGESQVIWVCHALTANSDCLDWWSGIFGPDKVFDANKHFIVCANILGSCYGSTGPLSINPKTGTPYYHQFPLLTIRDIVKGLDALRIHLGIDQIHTCIGGSLGGQQVLEWAVLQPDIFQHLILLATNAQHSAWGIAFNEAQRMAIETDPTWLEDKPEAGLIGMKAARACALLSYRNYETYCTTQYDTNGDTLTEFKAVSYQRYQGEKLSKRFNAFTYMALSRAMDTHNLARKRSSIKEVLLGITIKSLILGISSDILFPVQEQELLAQHMPNAHYEEIHSLYGHDGFLVETEKISEAIEKFYNRA